MSNFVEKITKIDLKREKLNRPLSTKTLNQLEKIYKITFSKIHNKPRPFDR